MDVESQTVKQAFEWARKSGGIRVLEGKNIPENPIFIPCSRCGGKKRTASFYLEADAQRKPGAYLGRYSDLDIRLCKECLQEVLNALS